MATYARPSRGRKATVTRDTRDTDEENEALKTALGAAIQDAIQYVDQELSPDRADATDYYKVRPLGNEEEGRSQFVVPEVRNAIRGAIPDLAEVIFGPEFPVEYVPDNPGAAAEAEIATEVAYSLFMEQNNGFLETVNVWKDALLKKLGIYKVWWDESETRSGGRTSGLTEEQVLMLRQEEGVEITEVEASGMAPPLQEGAPPEMLYDVTYERTVTKGRVRIKSLPPEEFIFSRNARDLDDAIFVGHRRQATVSELVALGYDEEIVREHSGTSTLAYNPEEQARNPLSTIGSEPNTGEENRRAEYIEGFFRYEGALWKICTLGQGYHILYKGMVEIRPFAVFCPDPEPHAIVGDSLADITMPFQRLKSSVVRVTLDSASAAIFPRTAYDENNVAVEDVLNTEVGAAIRTNGPPANALMSFNHNFNGNAIMPVWDKVDDMIERSTGQPKGVVSLDMDALQSTEKAAAAAAMRAGKAQSIMYARIFAESCLKPMFRQVLRLLISHQDTPQLMKLRDRWVHVDPRAWNMDWDVTVKVALGSGFIEQRIATLSSIAEKQELAMQNGGPDNPVTDIARYRNTLAEITKLSGRADVDKYWKSPQETQAAIEAAQNAPPPPPTPEMIVAQAEVEKVRQQGEQKEAELTLKAQAQEQDKQRDEAQIQADILIKREQAQLDAQLAREKLEQELLMFREKMDAEMQMKREEMLLTAQQAETTAAQTATENAKPQTPGVSITLPDAAMAPLQHAADEISAVSASLIPALQAIVAQMGQVAATLTKGMEKLASPKVVMMPDKKKRHLTVERNSEGRISGLTENTKGE